MHVTAHNFCRRCIPNIIPGNLFMLKCNIAMLRLTPLITLVALPVLKCQLRALHRRLPPPRSLPTPSPGDIVIAAFPIAWFFGFLYYTDLPNLISIFPTIVAATKGRHALASIVSLNLMAMQLK